jgi:hypothetical protein
VRTTRPGHPRSIFQRAIERENVIVAEATAREIGRLSLRESLDLVALYALRDRARFERAAARWARRWLEEAESPTLDELAFVVGCLRVLGGAHHARALESLHALAAHAEDGGRHDSGRRHPV